MSDPKGRFVWYELMTTDPDAAKEFYGDVVGWGCAPFEGAPMPYHIWMNGETGVGGLMDLPEQAAEAGAPPHWLLYVGTSDVDATVAHAEELGGSVIMPAQTIPEVGTFAVLSDPQGAVFAVFKPARDEEFTDAPPRTGQFSWHELATTDWEGAFQFYSELFGWVKMEQMDMGEAGIYQMYGRPGTEHPLGGMFNKPAEMPGPSAWLLYAKVPSVDAAVEKVGSNGGTVLNGPMEVPGGDMIAQCMDPQGAAFAVHASAS